MIENHLKLESLTFLPSVLLPHLSNQKLVCGSLNPIYREIQVYLQIPGITYPHFTTVAATTLNIKCFLLLEKDLFSVALVRGDIGLLKKSGVERPSAYQVQAFQISTHLTIKII